MEWGGGGSPYGVVVLSGRCAPVSGAVAGSWKEIEACSCADLGPVLDPTNMGCFQVFKRLPNFLTSHGVPSLTVR